MADALLKLVREASTVLRTRHGGLYDTRMRALRAIQDAGRRGLPQSELEQQLSLSRPGASKLVSSLVARGWIECSEHVLDRRKQVVTLLPEGKFQLDRCAAALDSAAEAVRGHLTQTEIEQLRHLLGRLIDSTDSRMEKAACTDCPEGGC
jgi:DNA-binding MarR family transcriptional regulator